MTKNLLEQLQTINAVVADTYQTIVDETLLQSKKDRGSDAADGEQLSIHNL